MDFYQELFQELEDKTLSELSLTKLKRSLALKHRLETIPSNIDILLHAPIKNIPVLKKKLITKPVRTISGVSPVAIMTAPSRCPHGKCTFCPGGLNSPWGDVPQSYTGHEPATMRGMRNNYDSYLQVMNRLEQYVLLGHTFDKIEIIVMGGTFPATEKAYQDEFITGCFQAMNDFAELFFTKDGEFNFITFKDFFQLPGGLHDEQRINNIKTKLRAFKQRKKTTLEAEQLNNETAAVRCVALCIETKPDWGFLEQGNAMLHQGCTRVELGIESVYDDVLEEVHRGHTTADSKRSIQILRDLGFKINFHYMPGLPLTDRERDIAGMKRLYEDPDYRPDMIKFYPTMVAPGTALLQQWKQGTFIPIDTKEAAERLVEIKKIVPEYCRIQRIQRDVPTKYWEAGVGLTNFRQYLHEKYDIQCRCIRCREPKGKEIDWNNIQLKVTEYEASGGKEFFIAAEDRSNDIILGFCRLRFPGQFLRSEITPTAVLVRELHIYGTATAIGDEGLVQHHGFGKKLIEKAEEIARQNGKDKMVIISGVGVRQYYQEKLGYIPEGPYVVKMLLKEFVSNGEDSKR
ncbi:tRNA uridine(34) 5-carboxymethylaminomethyl modification radical SAM/GNAT enzyme Elp3 [Candidatus Woesearchaeota archaeon]|nr:tRNA uridine(34) 5-carboxymethylaminomethyl modification radical SAM/GNAT enzyme Elp3 [Candidatus Woesearchaeota archaeon]